MARPRVRIFPPHFDAPLTKAEAESLASNPVRVSAHPFFPFLQRNQHWTKFAHKGAKKEEVEEKNRPIRYAARRDSYIFGYYRELLSPQYEHELARLGLSDCVLAYRRNPLSHGRGGKCNIHFAEQAFRRIRDLGNCYAFALDISQFFGHLDHDQNKQMWWRLLGNHVQKNEKALLPDDHFQVFKAVTHYSFIDRDCAYKALGLIGKDPSIEGQNRIKYLVKREDFPPQICTPGTFEKRSSDS